MLKNMQIRRKDLLATLRHKRERAFLLVAPIASDIRVGEMIMTDGFNLDNIDQSAKGSRTDDFRYLLAVGRVSHDCIKVGLRTWCDIR